ncbi:MAG: patatin-like phospholipase family protein [Flavobacteriia bacterium]|nr:patatin-like phospholipase family protein [Flavobacteriia bacterium]
MKKKFALVLSGGGFNGAFQVGALRYIRENWKNITGLDTPMKFDIISGVSAGAINGSLVAMNEFDLLHNLWVNQIGKNGASEIYSSEFIDTKSKEDKLKFKLDIKQLAKRLNLNLDFNIGIFEKVGMLFSSKKRKEIIDRVIEELENSLKSNLKNFKSIADNTQLATKLSSYLNRSKIKNTKFSCGFVSLNTGAYHSVSHENFLSNTDFINGVLASASIPAIWNPVDKISFFDGRNFINSHNNVDGGIINVSPFGDVIKMISEDEDECTYQIIAINCNSGIPNYEPFSNKSIGAIAVRSIYELTLTEVFQNDINHFLQINDIAKQVQLVDNKIVLTNSLNRPIKAFEATIINPAFSFELGSPLVANENLINKRIAHGYEQAVRTFNFKS